MVEVVNIDVIPLQVAKGLFELMAHVKRIIRVFRRPSKVPHFGGDDVIFGTEAQFLQATGQHPLGPAISIDIGVIKMIHAPIDRQLQSLGDLILVDIRPAVHLAFDPVFSS